MNDRQAEFISQEVDRLMDEAGGDGWLALRMSVVERLIVSGLVARGFPRFVGVDSPRFDPQPKTPSIDDPTTGVETQSTLD